MSRGNQTGTDWKIFKSARHLLNSCSRHSCHYKVKDSKIVCSHPHHAPTLRAARRARHKAVGCKGCELFRLAQLASRPGNHRARIFSAWQDASRVAKLTEPRPDLDKANSMRPF